METKCKMKDAVRELVRKFEKPTDEMIKAAKEDMKKQNDRILLIQN